MSKDKISIVDPTAWMSAGAEYDWPEDFPHENGMYTCICRTCRKKFLGHKRRTCCKVCHVKSSDERGDSMSKDKASDEYCDASVNNSVQGMKQMGVKGQDIIFALNRAILKLQYEDWKKREGKNNV